MDFKSPLIKASILKRYKRFLSDIELPSGEVICAHVPNTGSMTSCWENGWDAYLSESNNPKRKLKYTLEMTHNGESFISVNTSLTNKLVKEAIENKIIKEVKDYSQIKAEQKIFDSRIDFLLTGEGLPDTYIEVKNVTLKADKNLARFPDAVTTRGQKHIQDLIKIKAQGHRAIMLYVVNRTDVSLFEPADEIDAEYGILLRKAVERGVEVLVYQTSLSAEKIIIEKPLKYKL